MVLGVQVSRSLRTTLTFKGHHPIKENYNKDYEQDHVAHVLPRRTFKHCSNSCQTALKHVPCGLESISHLIQERILLTDLISNINGQALTG